MGADHLKNVVYDIVYKFMSKLLCIESYIDKDQNHYGNFLIEPLELGQGITLGNALRRTLLSDLTGFAITGARINNLKHEFAVIEGLREDILETEEFKLEGDLKRLISLNIKRLIDINCFKGRRHLKGLPVRGQRTRTNNRTSRRQSIFIRKK